MDKGNIMDKWALEDIARKLNIVRLMLDTADERSLTHGEKHHFNHVAKHFLDQVRTAVSDDIRRQNDEYTDEPNDIPF
jgi:hypothetical protein